MVFTKNDLGNLLFFLMVFRDSKKNSDIDKDKPNVSAKNGKLVLNFGIKK